MTAPIAISLDGVLGDTTTLWEAWLDDVARRAKLERTDLDVAQLDEALPNWRSLLDRFAEDHAPVYLRPTSPATSSLRRLRNADVKLGVFTERPWELARTAIAHLAGGRQFDAVETESGALERLVETLGEGTRVARTVEELVALEEPLEI